MPNTLCHIGIQTPLNTLVFDRSALIWVIIACIIPDLPWVLLKLLLASHLFNPFDLRLYCTAQASLLFCLLFSVALSLLSRDSVRIFIILGTNCFIHLLLDSLQIKWGNGVHLISPVNWEFLHFDIFWPEHSVTTILTIIGCLYLSLFWRKIVQDNPLQPTSEAKKITISILFFLLYFGSPFIFMEQLEKDNVYFVHTMRAKEQRTGQEIKLDRSHYFAESQQVRVWNGERLVLLGNLPEDSGRLSVSGVFLNSSTIQVDKYHLHRDHRDFASLLGLIMACTLVLHSLILGRLNTKTSH